MFQRTLKASPELAVRLEAAGWDSIEEVAYCPLAEFLKASGLSAKDARELRRIAEAYLLNEDFGDAMDL